MKPQAHRTGQRSVASFSTVEPSLLTPPSRHNPQPRPRPRLAPPARAPLPPLANVFRALLLYCSFSSVDGLGSASLRSGLSSSVHGNTCDDGVGRLRSAGGKGRTPTSIPPASQQRDIRSETVRGGQPLIISAFK